jgi:CRP/FNR family transcriptional regulator, cyclic AMP receptor protein
MALEDFLKKTSLSKRFSEEELALLATLMSEVSLEAGKYLMQEGEKGTEFFLLAEGELEILKQENESKEFYRIALLGPGNWVGEMALFTPLPRSASVRTTKPSRCYLLSIPELTHFSTDKPKFIELKTKLLQYFSEQIDCRLRETNEKMALSLKSEVESAKKRIQISYFLIAFSLVIYFYALALRALSILVKNPFLLRTFTNVLIVLFSFGVIAAIVKSKYPWSFYGVSLRNWKKYAIESFLYTLPILAALTLIKWTAIHSVADFHNLPLIGFGSPSKPVSYTLLATLLYLILVPLQELISRGGFQSCFQNFFSGKHRYFSANIITNLYFSVFHLHQSYILALFVFVIGLFWGWLYSRQGTLIGACVSHALVGVWALIFLDMRTLLFI